MFSLILAAAVIAQSPPSKATPSQTTAVAKATAKARQDAQEKAVVARRRVKRSAKSQPPSTFIPVRSADEQATLKGVLENRLRDTGSIMIRPPGL